MARSLAQSLFGSRSPPNVKARDDDDGLAETASVGASDLSSSVCRFRILAFSIARHQARTMSFMLTALVYAVQDVLPPVDEERIVGQRPRLPGD
jgi:hypothetical protein